MTSGALDQAIQGHQMQVPLVDSLSGQIWVVHDHVHAESPATLRHLPSDATCPDDAQGLPTQLDTLQARALPSALTNRPVGHGHSPCNRQHQRHGQLGGRDRVAARGIHHRHASLRSRGDVDVVHADACPAHHLEARRPVQQRGIYPSGAADDQTHSGLQSSNELRIGGVLDQNHVEAIIFAKRCEALLRHPIGGHHPIRAAQPKTSPRVPSSSPSTCGSVIAHVPDSDRRLLEPRVAAANDPSPLSHRCDHLRAGSALRQADASDRW